MKPTEEQAAIVEAAKSTTDNLLISALAGAAKTTTLELIAKSMVVPTLLLVFNKRIAEEAERRLPGHVSVRTMNSLGHRVWAAASGKRLVIDTKKSYDLLIEANSGARRRDFDFSATLALIRAAKQQGYIPTGKFDTVRRIISDDDFFVSLEEEPTDHQIDLLNKVLVASIKLSFNGAIDYDDQVYMPTLFGGTFPRFPLNLGDEIQDFSLINLTMLEKVVGPGRFIGVGDHFQSIYAFRGACSTSMRQTQERFKAKEMTLSVSFRCPKEVVRRAWWRAPTMKWAEGAEEGKVEELHSWNAESIPDGAAVLCRNNAPLFSLAMRLLKAGRGCHLVGTDLGPALIKTFKKLGDEDATQDEVMQAIARWEAERLEKSRSKAATIDKADCLRVFAGFGSTLRESVAYVEHIFASRGNIQLLSGHKSKGLEWDIVYHLDPWRIPSKWAQSAEDQEQEMNIRYVIETRAKKRLCLVTMEGFRG